jgi:hypothetical protein
MEASMINCRRVMMLGIEDRREVISTLELIIHLNHAIHHFASVLYLLALLGNLVIIQLVLSNLIGRFI